MFELIKGQIMAIMTQPFSELNLLALMPTTPEALTGGADATPPPRSPREMWRFIRAERKRYREFREEPPSQLPERSEMLMVKQLVYFERYGKMFLGDRPLIWDADVYRDLLALPLR